MRNPVTGPTATIQLLPLETAFADRRAVLVAQADGAILFGQLTQRPLQRDGRGRFLSRQWTAVAETYQPAELAWFRSPVGV